MDKFYLIGRYRTRKYEPLGIADSLDEAVDFATKHVADDKEAQVLKNGQWSVDFGDRETWHLACSTGQYVVQPVTRISGTFEREGKALGFVPAMDEGEVEA